MATNDTDLSFMRCPSCRSLVPGSAVRCRMCGHEFSTEQAEQSIDNESEQDAKPSRVRQKTISVSELEVDTLKQELVDQRIPFEQEKDAIQHALPQVEKSPKGISAAEALFAHAQQSKDDTDTLLSARDPQPSPNKSLFEVSDSGNSEASPIKKRRRRKRKRNKSAVSSEVQSVNMENMERTTRISASPITEEIGHGPLIGWIVIYQSNQDGTSIELRTGRFFVCREKIKEDDLVINHQTLSSPHALIRVEDSGTVKVQDLLSEQGTFIKKKGDQKYERQAESFALQHGDWVRFGEFEALICLIDTEAENET